ncbi:MAG: hypothetical protein ACR2OJ_12055, partial [Hyphomicrobiales bacterium]
MHVRFGIFATVLFAFLSSSSTVISQEILKGDPKPSRAEWAPPGMSYGRDFSTSDNTKVVMLGSGVPTGNPRHGGISVAVIVHGQPYIFDCGPGFFRNVNAAKPEFGG